MLVGSEFIAEDWLEKKRGEEWNGTGVAEGVLNGGLSFLISDIHLLYAGLRRGIATRESQGE